MSSLYLCVYDFQLIRGLLAQVDKYEDISITGISTTVHEHVNRVLEMRPDIFILQFADYRQCNQLVCELTMKEARNGMKIIVLCKDLDTRIIHFLLQYDIKSFLMEPYTCEQIMDVVLQKGLESASPNPWNVERIAIKTMHALGLPIHLRGFEYIKTCAIVVAQNHVRRRVVMGYIYQECARIHGTTPASVEKAIRTAIKYAYRTQPEHICIYNDKPTSAQIILYISEKIKLFQVM